MPSQTRRLLMIEEGKLHAFRPAEVTYLNARTYSDRTVDLVWGDDSPASGDRRPPRRSSSSRGSPVRMQFSLERRGFRGPSSSEPAQSLVRELRTQRQKQVAAAPPGVFYGMDALFVRAPCGTAVRFAAKAQSSRSP